MKYLLILIIRIYWGLIPKNKRRKCIFNKSCSLQVYEITRNYGFIRGIKELKFRMKNCRPEFDIYTDYKSGKIKCALKSGEVIDKNEISKRIISLNADAK